MKQFFIVILILLPISILAGYATASILTCDSNRDGIVDSHDLGNLASEWLTQGQPGSRIVLDKGTYSGDGQVEQGIAHDLGKTPDFVLIRPRNVSTPVAVALNGFMSATSDSGVFWGIVADDSLFEVYVSTGYNSSGTEYDWIAFAYE